MYNDKHVTAIIAGAGSGKRFGTATPKQFLKLNSKTVIERSVESFEKNEATDEIIIVTADEYIEKTQMLCECFSKLKAVIPGGAERQDSVYEALKLCRPGELVLIHDAARPFVSETVINEVIKLADEVGAAVPGVGVKDTIRTKESTLDRAKLFAVQTPQGFKSEIVVDAYKKAFEDGFYGTDDASLCDRLGIKVAVSEGDYKNIKITTPEDMPMQNMRIGTGFDVHKLVEGRKCILCGVDTEYEKGLLGHSDADVALHALMDAILGAAGLGDIGRHFPDSASEFKDISSMELLKRVAAMIGDIGYTVGNCDITIICERPKIAPHIEKMRQNIAEALEIPKECVNVKGTTTERLGFTGRGEGIASEAVCTLYIRR